VPQNGRVQARAELFRVFSGDASKGHEMTCVGRLMLVGAFDGLEQEPAAYLSALLDYSSAYWGEYGGGPKIAAYERSDRSHDSRWDDPRGDWFKAIDQRLRDAGYQARKAVHAVSVDRHWFVDEDVDWAGRIIATRLLQKGVRLEFAELACDSDWAMLELLRAGARALVEAPQRRLAA
jgi:hypothetical protein